MFDFFIQRSLVKIFAVYYVPRMKNQFTNKLRIIFKGKASLLDGEILNFKKEKTNKPKTRLI